MLEKKFCSFLSEKDVQLDDSEEMSSDMFEMESNELPDSFRNTR